MQKKPFYKNWLQKYKKQILWLFFFLWVIMIYRFSSQNSSQSSSLSNNFVSFFEQFLPNSWNLSLIIRKSAHFLEYFVLGGIAYLIFAKDIVSKTVFHSAFLLSFVVAFTDEFHQLFVAGRTGKITDVLIDSCGIIFGIYFIFRICEYGKRNRKEKKEID